MYDTNTRQSPYPVHTTGTWFESLSVRLPALVGYLSHDSRRFTCIYRLYAFRDVRAWMLSASDMTLADLHAYSDYARFQMCVHG